MENTKKKITNYPSAFLNNKGIGKISISKHLRKKFEIGAYS